MSDVIYSRTPVNFKGISAKRNNIIVALFVKDNPFNLSMVMSNASGSDIAERKTFEKYAADLDKSLVVVGYGPNAKDVDLGDIVHHRDPRDLQLRIKFNNPKSYESIAKRLKGLVITDDKLDFVLDLLDKDGKLCTMDLYFVPDYDIIGVTGKYDISEFVNNGDIVKVTDQLELELK